MPAFFERAERQHGLITREQLRLAGVSEAQLRTLLRRGRLERLTPQLFRVPGSVRTWEQQVLAAVLIAGPGTVASHLTAAALWRVPGFERGVPEVTRPAGRRVRHPIVHHTLYLPAQHVRCVSGIPVTSPPRMLFDICGSPSVHPLRADRALENGLRLKLATMPQLEIVSAELGARGRAGTRRLRALLDVRGPDYVPTESELEDLVVAVWKSAGLPPLVRQASVGGTTAPVGRIDFLDRPSGLVLEADSEKFHGGWLATEADHRRDLLLTAAGFHPLRATWTQLTHEADLVVAAATAIMNRAA